MIFNTLHHLISIVYHMQTWSTLLLCTNFTLQCDYKIWWETASSWMRLGTKLYKYMPMPTVWNASKIHNLIMLKTALICLITSYEFYQTFEAHLKELNFQKFGLLHRLVFSARTINWIHFWIRNIFAKYLQLFICSKV